MMKKKLLELRGIITVLNTLFNDNDAVDLPSLRKNVRYALEAGVAGFLVPAMAGEVDKLSATERRQIVEAVLAENGGQVPVIGGASAATGEARKQIAADLIELGCDGVLASIPFQDEEQYERDVREPVLPFDSIHEKVAEELIVKTLDLCRRIRGIK